MNSPHHHQRHDGDDDVHQQSLLWFFRFCNQRSNSSSSSSGSSSNGSIRGSSRRKAAAIRNKFAAAYQQKLLQQQRQSSNVFGRELIEHTELFSDQDCIPHIVKSCTRFIEKHGIIFGIYRLSGNRANIYKLRKNFEDNPKITMIESEAFSSDAHAVACVLKQYFRELPTPLLTFHMYEKFIGLFKQSASNINNTTDHYDSNIGCNNNLENNNDRPISNFIDEERDSRLDDEELMQPPTKPTTTATSTNPTPISNNYHRLLSTSTNNDTTTVKSNSSDSQTTTTSGTETPKLDRTQLITPSTSDSQLISLSSVVATNTSDLKYQFKLGDLRKLLQQLPKAHYQTLKYLMSHLARVAATGTRTGMDSKNVAIVWAPNLLKPRELELSAGLETLKLLGLQAVITEQLIKHHQFLFDEDDSVDDINK